MAPPAGTGGLRRRHGGTGTAPAPGGTELTDFHRDRLAVWQNEAEQVDEQGVSLDEWIRRMEDLTRREDPAAGIVRIMTIHKSKGLGFDIVILPQIGRDTPFANATHLTHFVKKTGMVE
ncbi:hypothetical protein M5E88_14590 [Akkermansia muciniphila]|nr:hypothetical protein M5E88_14590 [Akkermansia muciniphila]